MKIKDVFYNTDIDYSEQMVDIMVIHLDSDIRMRLSLDKIKQLEGSGGEVVGEPYMCDPGEDYIYVLDKEDVDEILETCRENEGDEDDED